MLVDDLMYLKRGGRLSAVSATFGTLLNIKPIIEFSKQGKLEVVRKEKGLKKALKSIVEEFSHFSKNDKYFDIVIVHTDNEKDANELANMLGLESVSKGEEVETVRYQLTEEANMFVYKNNNASYIIPIATGIYTEKVFFKKLEDAIRPYQNDISIVDKGNYWELNHGEIYVASGNYVGRCFSRYYYSSGIKHRKEDDVNQNPYDKRCQKLKSFKLGCNCHLRGIASMELSRASKFRAIA